MIIKPTVEDMIGYITTYQDLESVISEINNNRASIDIIATFPQDYKIIKYENKTYSIYPLSDENRKAIASSLTKYETKRRKKD